MGALLVQRRSEAITKGVEMFMGLSQYGACVMQDRLTAACSETLIVTLGDVLESCNAKTRARCGP